ncbi:calcium-binding protein, partial [Novimethylophilus kurashikiensis]|uniref:calcium-binding protein n=1 Tax=Novimethylophilus kurashikiensis TaxID=1825523 RepID=UPI003522D49F
MATVSTSFSSNSDVDPIAAGMTAASTIYNDAYNAFSYMTDFSKVDIRYYSSVTPTWVVAILTNGDSISIFGQNLTSFPATLTGVYVSSHNTNVNLSFSGQVTIDGSGGVSGAITKVAVIDGNATLTMYGTVFGTSNTGSYSNIVVQENGYTLSLGGSFNESGLNNISGTISSVRISDGIHSIGIAGIHFNYQSFVSYSSFSDFLSVALSGNDTINGSSSAEMLYAYGGNNVLNGLQGNDTLLGAAGNDLLNGGLGVDSMVGGLGDDIYIVDNASDVVTENADEGADLVRVNIATANGSYTLADNVEN